MHRIFTLNLKLCIRCFFYLWMHALCWWDLKVQLQRPFYFNLDEYSGEIWNFNLQWLSISMFEENSGRGMTWLSLWRRWFRKNSVLRMSFMSTLKMQIPWVLRECFWWTIFSGQCGLWAKTWRQSYWQSIFLKFLWHIVAWQSQWTIIKFQLCIDCPPLYTSSVPKPKFIMIVLQ